MTVTNNIAPEAVGAIHWLSRKAIPFFGICLVSVALAACAQSPAVTAKSDFIGGVRQTSSEAVRTSTGNSTVLSKKHVLLATEGQPTRTQASLVGLASYYSEGTRTASGERFNPQELTAAHPNLPFGTRLRVTNLATGRSVIVRVNDRGPSVQGRLVDVSYSAAQQLGFVDRGIAKVKLDVVQ